MELDGRSPGRSFLGFPSPDEVCSGYQTSLVLSRVRVFQELGGVVVDLAQPRVPFTLHPAAAPCRQLGSCDIQVSGKSRLCRDKD